MNFLGSSEDATRPNNDTKRPLYLFLIATLGVGALASLFTAPAIPTWYASLNHPAFAPPDWTLAPLWAALYVLMALAAWRVWKKTGLRSLEMAVFALQLALNLAWSVLFFGLHQLGAARIEIVVLDLTVLTALFLFFRRDRLAGLLLLPYWAWTFFATALTHTFWRLN